MKNTEPIYIALGTNIGDREANLQTAIDLMQRKATLVKESAIYITPPWGYADQPDFLNQVIEVNTRLEPLPLLRYLKSIEKKMGREKLIMNGPRLIDLDILFYGNRVVDCEALQVPHPRMGGRAFVLVPLNDIAPALIHPVLGINVGQMLTDVDTSGVTPL